MEKEPNKRIAWDDYFNHPFIQFRKHFKEDYKNKYKTIKKIGVGNNEVFLAENIQDKELRAMKIIKLEDIRLQKGNEYSIEEVNNLIKDIISNLMNEEIKNMEICGKNNENSIKYYESFETENEFAIIMELCDENLSKYRTSKKNKKLN